MPSLACKCRKCGDDFEVYCRPGEDGEKRELCGACRPKKSAYVEPKDFVPDPAKRADDFCVNGPPPGCWPMYSRSFGAFGDKNQRRAAEWHAQNGLPPPSYDKAGRLEIGTRGYRRELYEKKGGVDPDGGYGDAT